MPVLSFGAARSIANRVWTQDMQRVSRRTTTQKVGKMYNFREPGFENVEQVFFGHY